MKKSIQTDGVHSGESKDRFNRGVPPVVALTSTFFFKNVEELARHKDGTEPREEYGRYQNPTRATAERKLADLEGADDAILCSSGMYAIAVTLLRILKPGDHLLVLDEMYHRTEDFFTSVLVKFGVEVSVVKSGDLNSLRKAIKENSRLFLFEFPTNPHLYVQDLTQVVALCKEARVKTMVDATLASPVNVLPLQHGVDIVVHSCTKYLAGHNDLLAGVILSRKSIIASVRELHYTIGGVLDAHSSYLLIRGLKTLSLRMAHQNAVGESIASFLSEQSGVKKVFYPSLPGHPNYETAKRLMGGFGGVVAFDLGSAERAKKFVDALTIPYIAPSLGGTESLVIPYSVVVPPSSDEISSGVPRIEPGLVRLSVGLEAKEDLLEDIAKALKTLP
ncbi:MAG TPA: PLP-dependent aspartate aminotransferase family protein [Bacteroidota bacterium]|nr:PLP-dependent aspartate aminotransferase family protein [Bacteroidota bacterium]